MSHTFEPREHDTKLGVLYVDDMASTIHANGHLGFFFEQGAFPLVVQIFNDKDEPAVAVSPEDMFALRELLLSLPEERFKAPAPPVPRWSKGDIVIVEEGVNGRVLAYYRERDGLWRALGTAMVWEDSEVSAWVDNGSPNVIVVRQATA
jgi:hypothetical protein